MISQQGSDDSTRNFTWASVRILQPLLYISPMVEPGIHSSRWFWDSEPVKTKLITVSLVLYFTRWIDGVLRLHPCESVKRLLMPIHYRWLSEDFLWQLMAPFHKVELNWEWSAYMASALISNSYVRNQYLNARYSKVRYLKFHPDGSLLLRSRFFSSDTGKSEFRPQHVLLIIFILHSIKKVSKTTKKYNH